MFQLLFLPFLMLPAELPLAAFFWLLAFPFYGIFRGSDRLVVRIGAPTACFLMVAAADASRYQANPNGWLKFTGGDLFWMSAVPCGVALLVLLAIVDVIRRRSAGSSETEL